MYMQKIIAQLSSLDTKAIHSHGVNISETMYIQKIIAQLRSLDTKATPCDDTNTS